MKLKLTIITIIFCFPCCRIVASDEITNYIIACKWEKNGPQATLSYIRNRNPRECTLWNEGTLEKPLYFHDKVLGPKEDTLLIKALNNYQLLSKKLP